ncbi:MAG TPA: hypothetical protein VKR83_20575 [Ktedonobacteraceae bacterium]|nr:hypothetical protein [Ktedonobacteraceae bacterium]
MNLSETEQKSARGAVVSYTANTHLSGSWLIVARAVWLALVIPSLGLFVVGLLVSYQQIQRSCVDLNSCYSVPGALTAKELQALSTSGFSVSGYAALLTIFWAIIVAIWCGVGFLIFWRRSDDWLALLAAFFLVIFGITASANTFNALALASPLLALPLSLVSFLGDISLLLFFLLFPNGRLVPRWMGLILLLGIIGQFLSDFPSITSPFNENWPTWLVYLPLFVQFGVIVFSQIYRYRRVSTPIQRQQTKWIVLGVTAAAGILTGLFAISFPYINSVHSNALVAQIFGNIVFPVSFLLIPLSIGFSILRYRLYDIDVLINRTLVYGSLTALLALLYFGLIVALQALFQGVFHQNNAVAIVVSTLVIAALFQPLRRRLQAIIDRRFYRRKYDAARTVATFSATLRNEVDLTQLCEHLLAVVEETMQPSHVSLWLRPSEPQEKHQLAWRGNPPGHAKDG